LDAASSDVADGVAGSVEAAAGSTGAAAPRGSGVGSFTLSRVIGTGAAAVGSR